MKKTVWIALCICIISVFSGCSFGMRTETEPTTQQTTAPTIAPDKNPTTATTESTDSTESSPSTSEDAQDPGTSDSGEGVARNRGRSIIRHR